MDRDVIEAVLRANHGAVDATIDQLLAMSIDNQNESLRNEMEKSSENNTPVRKVTAQPELLESLGTQNSLLINTGPDDEDGPSQAESTATVPDSSRRWNPPMLLPLPPEFLRLSYTDAIRVEFDLPDEHFAKMLQNKEFVKQLRWNREFMTALDKEQELKGRHEDDAVFKERLKYMGQVSRRKFLQVARVFAWQKNKKTSMMRYHPEALPLKEEPSDEEDTPDTKK